jgi:hypothetical protein
MPILSSAILTSFMAFTVLTRGLPRSAMSEGDPAAGDPAVGDPAVESRLDQATRRRPSFAMSRLFLRSSARTNLRAGTSRANSDACSQIREFSATLVAKQKAPEGRVQALRAASLMSKLTRSASWPLS